MVANKRIGLREVRALKPGGVIWDGAVVGFGARRQRSKAVAYIVVYRTAEGRQRWHTIGRHGSPWTPDTAREAAKSILGEVADGADPAGEKIAKRHAKDVSDLCDLYIADAEAGRLLTRRKSAKKPSTIATDKGRIERHIKPLLGRMPVAAVTTQDVDSFMHAVAEGKTAARVKTQEARACQGQGRQRHGQPNGGPARLDLLLCGAAPHAARQPRARSGAVRGRHAQAATVR